MPESTPASALRVELARRIMGFIISQAVYVATRLGIPDLLANGPRPAAELAGATGAHPDALYRLLRMLAGNGIFVEQPGMSFGNSELSDLLRDTPGSFRDFALVFGEEFYPAFGELLHAIETGEPAFETRFEAPWDDYLAANPERSARFNRFMASGKDALAEVLAAGWRGDELIVDVGGGNGALLQALLERHPGLRGIVFDLPHVAMEAQERIRTAGLAARCQIAGGDYFDGVPAGGDVYVLSHILHGWDDDRAGEILRALRDAIPEHGRVLIVDGVVAPPNEPGLKLMDLLMLTVHGRERTEEEWRQLITASGFELTEIRPAPFGSILEAAPK